MGYNRRDLLGLAGATAGVAAMGLGTSAADAASKRGRAAGGIGSSLQKPFTPTLGPRSRVLVLNDISGDADGLYATVHAFLSPSTDVRGFIGTCTPAPNETAEKSTELGREIAKLMNLTGRVNIYQGADKRLVDANTPARSPGIDAIIAEAMRTDTSLPLFVTVGGGLTEVASAIMLEPRIAERFTLVWIGGRPYPSGGTGETNFNSDRLAAQFIFNSTKTPIWQVTSDAYALCQVSITELQQKVAPHGAIGHWLFQKSLDLAQTLGKYGLNTGETWTLGDSPLVLLTALTTWFPSGGGRAPKYDLTGGSVFQDVDSPILNSDGTYSPNGAGRKIRVYQTLDTRLMLDDFFAKLALNYPA